MTAPSEAFAKPEGEPQACANCHYGKQEGPKEGPKIKVSFSDDKPEPGDTITLTINIEAVNIQALRTGVMVTADSESVFELVDKERTKFAKDVKNIVLHSQAQDLKDGKGQFKFKWNAPDTEGVTEFDVWSMTGNSDGKDSNDHTTNIKTAIAYGCDATEYYPDEDKDGFGDVKNVKLSCEPVEGFITEGGDCDDDKKEVHPGAEEKCNSVDDDCDGDTDEELMPGIVYKDTDGDGYASANAKSEYGCAGLDGFVDKKGDCKPNDPDIHPGAKEDPDNGIDDNCNGKTDEVGDEPEEPEEPEEPANGSTGGCAMANSKTSFGTLPLAMLFVALLLRRRRKTPR